MNLAMGILSFLEFDYIDVLCVKLNVRPKLGVVYNSVKHSRIVE